MHKRLPMGAKCGEVTCCGLWPNGSSIQILAAYSLFGQTSGVGSREARLPPINGWQVRDKYKVIIIKHHCKACMNNALLYFSLLLELYIDPIDYHSIGQYHSEN